MSDSPRPLLHLLIERFTQPAVLFGLAAGAALLYGVVNLDQLAAVLRALRCG